MPRIEGTLMPPSLKATGVTKKGPNPHIKTLPRKPSKTADTGLCVNPCHNSEQFRSFTKSNPFSTAD